MAALIKMLCIISRAREKVANEWMPENELQIFREIFAESMGR